MRISDCSSDVCSSDLLEIHARPERVVQDVPPRFLALKHGFLLRIAPHPVIVHIEHPRYLQRWVREMTPESSEESSVGKECVCTCRSRWAPCRSKKNKQNTYMIETIDIKK